MVLLQVEPLSTFGVETQEQLLIEDLLGTISGYEGRYIKVEAAHDGTLPGVLPCRSTPPHAGQADHNPAAHSPTSHKSHPPISH